MARQRKMTERQREVYLFIRRKIRSRGYGPTVREIAKEFDILSPNGVMGHLNALVKKGLITREANRSRAISLVHDAARDREAGLPLAGTIAAGAPLETYQQEERVDFGDLFDPESHFALKVRGDSMVDDHIADGDFVIVRTSRTARDGQIVVAMVEGSETTLKRFYRDGKRYRLMPANRSMKPIRVDHVDILGVVVGVVRTFR